VYLATASPATCVIPIFQNALTRDNAHLSKERGYHERNSHAEGKWYLEKWLIDDKTQESCQEKTFSKLNGALMMNIALYDFSQLIPTLARCSW
jgi:hypothetical protein